MCGPLQFPQSPCQGVASPKVQCLHSPVIASFPRTDLIKLLLKPTNSSAGPTRIGTDVTPASAPATTVSSSRDPPTHVFYHLWPVYRVSPGVTVSCPFVREQKGSNQGFGVEVTEKKTGVLRTKRQKVGLTVDQLLKAERTSSHWETAMGSGWRAQWLH